MARLPRPTGDSKVGSRAPRDTAGAGQTGSGGRVTDVNGRKSGRTLGSRVAPAASRIRGDLPLVVIDVLLIIAVYVLLFAIRFDFRVPTSYWNEFRVFLPVACAVSLAANWGWGCYGRTWRHASIDEAVRLILAGATSGVILLL